MAEIRKTLEEREYDKFVESPSRPGKTAVEVTGNLNATFPPIQNVNVVQTVLPPNAATLTEQQSQTTILNSILTGLGAIYTAITGVLNIRPLTFLTDKIDASGSSVSVSNFPASQNVVVTSSALPTGAATSANQTTANGLLNSILSAITGVLNIRSLVFATDKVDVSGSAISANISGVTKSKTYSAVALDFNASAAATDIFTIQGSATKKIKIHHISISGTQTNISRINVLLKKRSTLNSGGTSVVVQNVAHDSTNPAATAIVRYYTANPTLGNDAGTVQAEKVTIGSTNGANISTDDLIYKFGFDDKQEIILNNENESLSVNLNGVTLNGNIFAIDVKWIEV